jgi:hypothetical protein
MIYRAALFVAQDASTLLLLFMHASNNQSNVKV